MRSGPWHVVKLPRHVLPNVTGKNGKKSDDSNVKGTLPWHKGTDSCKLWLIIYIFPARRDKSCCAVSSMKGLEMSLRMKMS